MDFNDYREIQSLLFKYPEYADTGNIEGVGELFAHCEVHAPGHDKPLKAIGAKAFADMYRQWVRLYPPNNTPRTRHVMSNIDIVPDGAPDRAKARSYVVVFQGTDKLPLQPVIAGTYLDKFAKIDGVWRFVERREEMELAGDLSQHLLLNYPAKP